MINKIDEKEIVEALRIQRILGSIIQDHGILMSYTLHNINIYMSKLSDYSKDVKPRDLDDLLEKINQIKELIIHEQKEAGVYDMINEYMEKKDILSHYWGHSYLYKNIRFNGNYHEYVESEESSAKNFVLK
jgi:hypothetical protein